MTSDLNIVVPIPGIAGKLLVGGDAPPKTVPYDIAIRIRDGVDARDLGPAPWNPQTGPLHLTYAFVPGNVNRQSLIRLFSYIMGELKNGKTVFIGYGSGRNRVAMFAARVYQLATGDKDAAAWTIKNFREDSFTESRWVDFMVRAFNMLKPTGLNLRTSAKMDAVRFSDEPPLTEDDPFADGGKDVVDDETSDSQKDDGQPFGAIDDSNESPDA